MRRSFPFFCIIFALFAFASLASAQSVTTVPVGFNTSAVPAAIDANTPSSTVISVPFYQPADFTGAVASVDSSNQLSISGASFTPSPGAGDLVTVPHLARLKTGASVGRFFIVTANTATQLTLDTATAGYTLTTGAPNTTQAQVVAGDSVEILPANTLASLFGSATVPFQTGASANAADNVYLFNGTGWDVYYNNGTNWKKSGSLANQNNTIVLPDKGMFILRRAAAPLNLTFLGTVPSSSERTDFTGPASTFKANRFPVDTTLLGMGLQGLPNWLAGASASAADNVYLWSGTGWNVYYYNGTNWKKSGSLTNQNTTPIPLGTAMFVVRQSTAAGSTSTLVQALPYSL
jgi:uncharacterized protein (TIGR02597 family)